MANGVAMRRRRDSAIANLVVNTREQIVIIARAFSV